jgi:hypothetical protein
VEFELKTPVLERVNIVHALDRAVIVMVERVAYLPE